MFFKNVAFEKSKMASFLLKQNFGFFFKLWKITTLYNTTSLCILYMLLQHYHASNYVRLYLTLLETKMADKMATEIYLIFKLITVKNQQSKLSDFFVFPSSK